MKTIKILLVLVAVLALMFMVGCGGQRHATLKTEKDGSITHDDWNMSLLQSSIGPNQLANAKATVITAEAQADLTRSLAKQIEQGQGQAASISGRYMGLIINDDPQLTAYVPHPEMNQKIKIAPGSYAFLATNSIADRISIYDAWGNYTTASTHKKGGVYNGVKYDYGVRIYKVR